MSRELILAKIRRRAMPSKVTLALEQGRVATFTFPSDLTQDEARRLGEALAIFATDDTRLAPGDELEVDVQGGPFN